jgi:hypothetical protein
MAFNPFETFSVKSRTGKSVMAVLGIVVMLTFVLSSGAIGSGNDIFDQMGGLFSSKKGRGEVIATAYGDDIRQSELTDARKQRQAAREFLIRSLDLSYTKWTKDLDNDVKSGRLTGDTKDFVQRFVSLRLKSDTERQAYYGYLGQFVGGQQFGQEIFKFMDVWRKAKPDSDDKKALDAVVAIMVNDVMRAGGQSPMYLVPLNVDSDRDMLDFILLLKKADRLGVQFSTEGVKDLIARDTAGRLTTEDLSKIDSEVRGGGRLGNVSSDWLTEAVANEYRAKIAQSALDGKPLAAELFRVGRAQPFQMFSMFGIDLTSTRAPGELATETAVAGALTPYEFFEYYKDRCSENSFDVLEVNAEAFLDQVKEQPTKAELNSLFAKHVRELPDPSRERPGFKEPRKVKVEYATLDANAPRVKQAIPKVQAASLFLCISGGAMSGSPMAGLAEAAQPAMAETLPIREAVGKKMEANLERYTPYESFYFSPRDTSVFRPQPIASALGVLAGQADFANFIAATAAIHQQVERLDHQARVPLLLQAVLTPFNPTFGNGLGMPALAYAHIPKLPPEGLYLPEATANVRKEQVRNLFQADVRRLEDKLFEFTKDASPIIGKPDKEKVAKAREEAKKYLADWLKERGLTAIATKTALDQFTLGTDPDLKALNAVATPEPDGTNSLSKQLFEMNDPRFGGGPIVGVYRPFWFPSDPAGEALDKPNHLVWETEDVAARDYNNLDNADKITNGEMSKRVERAWRLDKARVLAKAEADRLAEQVKGIAKAAATNPTGVGRQLKDLAAEKKFREFALDRMAKLKFEHGLSPNQQEYKQPTIEKTQVLYPTSDFVEKLLDLRKEPVGAVTVLPDAPRTHFYVACLVEKQEKTVEQFRDVFDKATVTGLGRNPLYGQYALPEEQFRAFKDSSLRLRADAGLSLKEAFQSRERKEEE